MAPLILEIASSVIFPKANGLDDGSIAIDMAPPPAAGLAVPVVKSSARPRRAPHLTGPNHPLYRLPQSISSGGLKVHLNIYVPPKKKGEEVRRFATHSSIDEEHIIFEIAKASLGESSYEYTLTNFLREDGSDAYGRGRIKFTPGWLSGGYWEVKYVYKSAGHAQESRVDLKCDEGGKEDGIWRMTFPMDGVIAREIPQLPGSFGENGKAIEILDGSPGLEGWDEAEWWDFLTACWVAKTWNTCTRTEWLGASIRNGEVKKIGTW